MYIKLIISLLSFLMFGHISNLSASVIQTKFNPGPYITSTPSVSLSHKQAHAHNIKLFYKHAKEKDLQGFKMTYRWSALEPQKGVYKLDPIAELLDLAKQYNKQVGIAIDVRAFSAKKCPGKEQPRWMIQEDMLYFAQKNKNNKVCLPKWWQDKVMQRLIMLYQEIGKRFDQHPNFEFVTEGESTIEASHGYSEKAYHAQMTRLITEAKKALPNTMLIMQINFYHNTQALLEHMIDVGGVGFGLPDMVPCRIPDKTIRKQYTDETCSYFIDNYDYMIKYKDVLAITPNAETWDLFMDQTESVYLMAANYLKANYLFFTESFCSRRDPRGCDKSYMEKEIIPTIRKLGNILDKQCPSSFGQCIENR